MTHTLPELERLVRAALDCLEASGPHRRAMFHVNLLALDDPSGRVAGYRDGAMTSLDEVACAQRIPFRSRTGELHAALLACLAAFDAAGQPLYLLRLRFSRAANGWELTKTSLQGTEARVRFLRERKGVEDSLKAALNLALTDAALHVALTWKELPGQTVPMVGRCELADGTNLEVRLEPETVAAAQALKAFYTERGFALDSAYVALERRADELVLRCDDYYG